MKTYKRHRFPPDIISYAVWLYYRFNLSHRDIEDLLAERGITVSREDFWVPMLRLVIYSILVGIWLAHNIIGISGSVLLQIGEWRLLEIWRYI